MGSALLAGWGAKTNRFVRILACSVVCAMYMLISTDFLMFSMHAATQHTPRFTHCRVRMFDHLYARQAASTYRTSPLIPRCCSCFVRTAPHFTLTRPHRCSPPPSPHPRANNTTNHPDTARRKLRRHVRRATPDEHGLAPAAAKHEHGATTAATTDPPASPRTRPSLVVVLLFWGSGQRGGSTAATAAAAARERRQSPGPWGPWGAG